MKFVIIILAALLLFGCHSTKLDCLEEVNLQIKHIVENVNCVRPVQPTFTLLDVNKHIGEKNNMFGFMSNYINVMTYSKDLENTVNCYENTFKNIKDL